MSPAPVVSAVIARGAQAAQTLQETGQQAPESSVLDVWTQSHDGMAARMNAAARDPLGFLAADQVQQARIAAAQMPGQWSRASIDQTVDSVAAQAGILGQQVQAIQQAQGALQTIGASFALLTSIEQMLSTALSVIPFPAFPAVRIGDMDIGLPHGHSHPPNLVPPAPMVPLPSTGPIIPIPILSGASKTLINGMPAARCGDMGLGIWCGGYFPMYEVFLGSSSVWIEGARAARVAVDITKHCMFTTPKPRDPPLGPMIGMTISSSPNVLIGGIPMPSLTSLAIGAAVKGLFSGLGKVVRRIRAARMARATDDLIPMFSKGRLVSAEARAAALADVLDEARLKGVEIRADEEAAAYLDYCARAQGIDPSQMHAATLGDDLVMIRPEHADNPRILREELIHTDQARAGRIASDTVVENEIAARRAMIENAEEWGITSDEVAEMEREIAIMTETGRY